MASGRLASYLPVRAVRDLLFAGRAGGGAVGGMVWRVCCVPTEPCALLVCYAAADAVSGDLRTADLGRTWAVGVLRAIGIYVGETLATGEGEGGRYAWAHLESYAWHISASGRLARTDRALPAFAGRAGGGCCGRGVRVRWRVCCVPTEPMRTRVYDAGRGFCVRTWGQDVRADLGVGVLSRIGDVPAYVVGVDLRYG
ncbi:hypothetical protein C8J57DRAFT_1326072 [Mycena rebaudengoi]|nr:hypothetical protein C8J57DRAFT_1326072 [Mycena rebaudengoi]